MTIDENEGLDEDLAREVVTLALVLRISGRDVRRLLRFVDTNHMNAVYRNISYGPLYISKTKHDD